MQDYSDMVERPNSLRICGDCQKEHNINWQAIQDQFGWSITHGLCPRHIYRQYKSIGYTDQRAKEATDRYIETRRVEKKGCRDLSLPQNQEILYWLKNPTPAPKAAE